jgi:hypothetical protein
VGSSRWQGRRCIVFDVDATRQAARKPALPCDQALPAAKRRLDAVCAPGYTGRKRGEVVRTRTTVLQMHTRQWVGTYAGRGNGDYRGELASALRAISTYLKHFGLTPEVAQSASRWAIWRCGGDCAAHTSRRQSGDAREGLSHLGPSPTPAGARSSTDSTRDQDEHGRGPRAV